MNRYDRNLQIIYVGIVISTLVYAVVAWASTHAVVRGLSLTDELRVPSTLALYGGAAIALLAAAVIRSRRLLRVRWAMLEMACICGLVAALLHGDWRLYVAPWTLALVGFMVLLPRVRMAAR